MAGGLKATAVLLVITTSLVTAQDGGASLSPDSRPPSMKRNIRRNVYYIKEEQIELACIAEGDPKPQYYWVKNGDRLNLTTPENRERMSMSSGVGSLYINNAKDSDEGVYQCVAENVFGKSLSIKRNVQQARMDPFPSLVEPDRVSAIRGRSTVLHCNPPLSIPPAKINWIIDAGDYDAEADAEDDGFNFVDMDDRITMDYDGNLYITRVIDEDAQDGNKYVCMANNKVVRSFNQGSDKILEPKGLLADMPVTLMWHSEVEVLGILKKKAKFKCIFAGNPQPTIKWTRIGGKMDNARMKRSKDGGFELEISKIKYDDKGVYECEGNNPALGIPIKKQFNLRVESKPMWLKEPKDVTVGVEENAVFSCASKGTPKPTVQWYINGNPIESEPPSARRKKRGDKLEFFNLTRSDSQVIQCNATNKNGFIWTDIFLHVLAIPAKVDKAPLKRQKVAEGQDVTVSCESSGKPKPKVIWFKGAQELSGPRHKILDNGNLVIKEVNVDDNGNYKCFATNRFGKDTAEGTLTVRRKTIIDEEPIDLLMKHGNNATFKCQATTDPNEQVEYYWLRDGERLENSDPRIQIQEGILTITRINAEDTADYVCMASNGLDNTTATAKLEVIAPPDAPFDVQLISCYADKATIEWKFNDDQNNFSPLQNFIVEYNTTFNKDDWVVGARVPADARTAEVKLSLWVQYNFRVKAVNRVGVGNPSEINTAKCETPQGRPERHPRKVTTVGDKTGYLVVEWEPMPPIEHNAPNFFYNITVKETDTDNQLNYVVSDYTEGRKEIPVNKVYEPYTVIVRAQNSVGQPFIQPVPYSGFSGEGAPTVVPENFELDPSKNVSATSAGFRWDPVDTSTEAMQGEFKGYKVRFWKVGQKDDSMHEVFIPHTSKRRRRQADNKITAEVRNLPSYSEIEADVVAVNNYFSSGGSNIVNFSTPEGVPSEVEYLEALYRGSSHFLLEWGEPKEPNGNVTGYKVGYRIIRGIDLGQLEVGEVVSKRRVFLGGLSPDTLYRVYVWGMTREGQGDEYYIDVRTAEPSTELARPIVVEVLPGLTSVNVTWRLPEIKGIRVGSNYFLEYREIGESVWKSVPEQENENFWQEIDGLEEATQYEVRVVATGGKAGTAEFRDTNSDVRSFTTAGQGSVKANVLSAGWFIGMMVAIAILLLILIIVCIIKRNRGDKYHVQEKERLRGSNQDDGPDHFNEYAKSDENGVGQSNSFENNPEKMPLEYDETDSMEDYGDVDPGKFNEDGSFIGQYGVQNKSEAANASAMSTLV